MTAVLEATGVRKTFSGIVASTTSTSGSTKGSGSA